ncbi:MAG: aryl-sulfate sulfotransferase [Candidatus Omnitrophica bacterium]|nr:aryl-sulfate sulfotransferase [Candidatus Omnitrophota bacterium]
MRNKLLLFAVLILILLNVPNGKTLFAEEADPDFIVDIYNPSEAFNGTTLVTDNYSAKSPRVIEVDMNGKIVWEYILPPDLRRYTNPGFDIELLPNNNILIALPRKGVYEISRSGKILWSYLDPKISHDVDRLPNGNTLLVWGGEDEKSDAQVKEIDPRGAVVWRWYAKDHFDTPVYSDIYSNGWTHANAATRLPNGNTLISLRNFNIVVEVDPDGMVKKTIGEGVFHHQHDPETLTNGNLLVANHGRPQGALEIEPESGRTVWKFEVTKSNAWPVRDANRLPNGNTLITGTNRVIEVSPKGEIVWQLKSRAVFSDKNEAKTRGFYKAIRIE